LIRDTGVYQEDNRAGYNRVVADGIMSSTLRLAAVRSGCGWTQAELAERSGVPRSSISAIEIGRLVPSVETALTLARTLGVSVEALFAAAGAPGETPALAWTGANPVRWLWTARVGKHTWRYPVEATAAGWLPPDEELVDGAFEPVTDRVARDRTLVIAGCDPSVALLASAVSQQSGIRVLPLQRSSRGALELLRSGRVHVAGVHVSDARGRGTNAAEVRQRLGAGYSLLHQMRWDEGVAVAAPLRGRSIDHLLEKARWVNREPGAAARACLDRLLGTRPQPTGYRRVVRSHHAVAATVSSGWAEAGVCVRPVAADAGLDFVSVQQADYELCIPDALLDDPVAGALVDAIRSKAYRRWLAALPGCVVTRSGDLRTITGSPGRRGSGPTTTE
jgi:molybdate-binding protein/DNA-binding XRE family transcriptional regulator